MNSFGMLFYRKAFICYEGTMTIYTSNRSIAQQCLPTSFTIHHSSFIIADLAGAHL